MLLQVRTEVLKKRSGANRAMFDQRCTDYVHYVEYKELDFKKTFVVFACDTERDEEYAHQAAVRHDLPHVWAGSKRP